MDPPSYDNAMSMPTSYNSGPEPNTVAEQIGMSVGYVKSPTGGILKIVELVFSMVCFICSSVWGSEHLRNGSGQWVQFVALSSFILTLVLSVLYVFQVPEKMPPHIPFALCEVIYYAVYTVFYFISAIIASVYGGYGASVAAAAFFTWTTFIIFAIDLILRILAWRNMTPAFISRFDTGAPGSQAHNNPTSTGAAGPPEPAKTQY